MPYINKAYTIFSAIKTPGSSLVMKATRTFSVQYPPPLNRSLLAAVHCLLLTKRPLNSPIMSTQRAFAVHVDVDMRVRVTRKVHNKLLLNLTGVKRVC